MFTRSHATELAILANMCTAPSNTHSMYEVEKIVVQTALKHKNMRLIQFLRQHHTYNIMLGYSQKMVSRTRPGIMCIACVEEEGGQAQLGHRYKGHEKEEKRMVLNLGSPCFPHSVDPADAFDYY